MRILLVGVGTVGEAIARMCAQREWCEAMVLADYDAARAATLHALLADPARFPVEQVDARDPAAVAALAQRHRVDLVMNAVDPRFVMPIFDGALAAGVHYMDMATSLSRPHPEEPFRLPGLKLGDEQFARPGGILQARRDVHGVADDRVIGYGSAADVADEGFAACDAGADLKLTIGIESIHHAQDF